jgi:predicted acyl esterase
VRAVYSGSDPFGAGGQPTDSLGPAGHASALATTSTLVSLWGSWWDGGTADAVFRADTALPLAHAVIGGWTHEGDHDAGPLRTRRNVAPTVVLDSVVAFFARTVRADPVRPDSAARVRWYVAGREAWRSAATWPRATGRRWMLREAMPAHAPDAVEAWQAKGNASTGTNTRWTTGLARPVDAPERANAVGVHRYRLPVLTDSLEVLGEGRITCALAADRAEGTLQVYLEAEDAAGRVRLLTEETQRVRRVDTSGDTLPDVSLRLRIVHSRLRVRARINPGPSMSSTSCGSALPRGTRRPWHPVSTVLRR